MDDLVLLIDDAIREDEKRQADMEILGWLDGVERGSGLSETTAADEQETATGVKSTETSQLTTPMVSRVGIHGQCGGERQGQGISPTDTTFSYGYESVFDSPSPVERELWERYRDVDEEKAAGAGLEELGDGDGFSDITSVCGDENEDEDGRVGASSKHTALDNYIDAGADIDINITPLASLTPELPPASPITPNPNKTTHLVWLTSCLQCTLANLPCSRTPPACSRCERSQKNEPCLLQRRRTLSEIQKMGDLVSGGGNTPVLLRLEGDNEEVWGAKKRRMGELLEEYRYTQDRRNWVLPLINGTRGSYRYHGFKVTYGAGGRLGHPGDGIGRTRSLEVGDEMMVEL